MSIRTMGDALREAGHLDLPPLCVFESPVVPEGSVPFGSIDRCIAKAVLTCALGRVKVLHIGLDARSGVCPGGQAWTGLAEMGEGLKYFISTGSPTFRHGEAEFLKRSPALVVESRAAAGRIRPPERYLCIARCHDFDEGMGAPRALLLFARAEQLRNLIALHHFGTADSFGSTSAPWGPSCASFLSYPAGLASGCPPNALIIGPTDPTGNDWLPPDMMSLGIPLQEAERMVADIPLSFLTKREGVAFPGGR